MIQKRKKLEIRLLKSKKKNKKKKKKKDFLFYFIGIIRLILFLKINKIWNCNQKSINKKENIVIYFLIDLFKILNYYYY